MYFIFFFYLVSESATERATLSSLRRRATLCRLRASGAGRTVRCCCRPRAN
jgi:hypothetical protein